jgi:hypothetical protein
MILVFLSVLGVSVVRNPGYFPSPGIQMDENLLKPGLFLPCSLPDFDFVPGDAILY